MFGKLMMAVAAAIAALVFPMTQDYAVWVL